jgi:hypothetical protein
MRKILANKSWIGSIKTKEYEIWLYTNVKRSTFWAYYHDKDNYKLKKVLKTKSWKKFMEILQKDLIHSEVIESIKNLWVDRWLWTNKPLHEYILNY